MKIYRRRRAVSPILAAILLIGLAVAAGAVLFVVVLPLIDNPGGSVVFDETLTDFPTNSTMKVVLKNEGTVDASITDIVVSNSTVADLNFNFVAFSINKGQGATKSYTLDDTLSPGSYTITVTFTVDGTEDTIAITLTV
jgi:flagellin-like protein